MWSYLNDPLMPVYTFGPGRRDLMALFTNGRHTTIGRYLAFGHLHMFLTGHTGMFINGT